jgi:hypothetical protein
MILRAGFAALAAATCATAALADPAHDQKLYDDLRYYFNRNDCEVARPLLVEFSGVCFQYENSNPGLCNKISKAIEHCSQQARGTYTADGDTGQDGAHVIAEANPLPLASLGQ